MILHQHNATPQPNWNYWAVALVRDTNVYLPFVHHKINMKLPLCRDLHFNLMSCSRFFKRFFVRLSRVFQTIKDFWNLPNPFCIELKIQKMSQFICYSFFDNDSKVIHPKYSFHWPYTVAHTIDWVCTKMLNHGLNPVLFLFWLMFLTKFLTDSCYKFYYDFFSINFLMNFFWRIFLIFRKICLTYNLLTIRVEVPSILFWP